MSLTKRSRFVLKLIAFCFVVLLGVFPWARVATPVELHPYLQVLGNLHPVFLHLPIGIFIYLALAEFWNLFDKMLFKVGQIPGAFPWLSSGPVVLFLRPSPVWFSIHKGNIAVS